MGKCTAKKAIPVGDLNPPPLASPTTTTTTTTKKQTHESQIFQAKLICFLLLNIVLSHIMQVGDKMPDTGVLHLPSYLDKTITYGYMKADLEDDNEDAIHYSISAIS